MKVELRTGRRTVAITHAERPAFARATVTKLELAHYYAEIAPAMIRHVRSRPLALQGFPGGAGESYFIKNEPRHYPDWIANARVPKREGGTIRQVLANDPATLVYLAGQNVVTLHIWTSRSDRLELPDRLVFDLDPSSKRFGEVRAAARELGVLLAELGLVPFAMTTGSRGLHVVTPLRRSADHETVHAFSREVAAVFAATDPARLTVEFRRNRRGERIFIDVGRNGYAQHSVAPYSVRGLPGAPVATPLRWEELEERSLRSQSWSVANVRPRVESDGDPWREIARHARSLGPARRALERLVDGTHAPSPG